MVKDGRQEKMSKLLGTTWQESMLFKNIISSFTTTGIYPMNSSMFPQDKFDPEKYRYAMNLNYNQVGNVASVMVSLTSLLKTSLFQVEDDNQLLPLWFTAPQLTTSTAYIQL